MFSHIRRLFDFAQVFLKYYFNLFEFKVPIDFEEVELSSINPGDESLENAITAIERNGLALKVNIFLVIFFTLYFKGNVETKFDNPLFKSRNVEIRRRLDLYANVLNCVSIPSVPSRQKNLDIVLIRENTEGEYSGLEHESVTGVIESLKVYL